MKILGTILLVGASLIADITTVVQNNGAQVHLTKYGQSFMIFSPQPQAIINQNDNDSFIAFTTISQISSLKLIYSSQNNSYSPACEFLIEIQQDAQSQLFVVKKIEANRLRPITGMTCNANMQGFNPSTGDSDVLFTMTIPSNKKLKKIKVKKEHPHK